MKLAVIGTGYVGLVAGAGFSDFGNDVACVDIDAARIERLKQGEIPIYEPGLAELVKRNADAGRLTFTTELASAVAGADAVFLAVGTPSSEDGSADLKYVLAAAEQVARALSGWAVIVTKSTVPVGTADRIREAMKPVARHDFSVASNPEFLKEGDAVNDFMKPARIVLGCDDDRARELLLRLYAPFVRTNDRILTMDVKSAELTKYAANAMLATRISFMNELALLAEKVGADIERVRKGIGSDPRIGPKFLFPGVGFGGSCLLGRETVLVKGAQGVELRRLDELFPEGANDAPIASVIEPTGLEVLTQHGRGRPRFLPVRAITRRPWEGEILEVVTKMGRRVRCTPDHPFVAMDANGESTRVVTAEELTTESWLPVATGEVDGLEPTSADFDIAASLDEIGVRRNDVLRLDELRRAGLTLEQTTVGTCRSGTYVPAKISNTPAFWRVLGLYSAEGWISTDRGRDGAERLRVAWSFHPTAEEDLVAEVASYWEALGVKASVHTASTTRKVSFSSRILGRFLRDVLSVGVDSYTKRVPDALWSAPREHKLAYLSGLWHGDGSWSYVANRRGVVLELGTVSKPLADGVLRLLSELGVVASWKVGRLAKSTVDTHFVRISGAAQIEQLLCFVRPVDREAVRAAIASADKRIAPTGFRGSEPARVRVMRIERKPYQGYVYSLEVPGPETFVTTGNLVVHNCFPKDVRALTHTAHAAGMELAVVEAVERANERQKRVLGERIAKHFGELRGRRIAIWGLAFKPETDDIREAPALVLIDQLLEAGAEVAAFDPVAADNVQKLVGDRIRYAHDMYDAVKDADALVLVTEWHVFRRPDFARIKSSLREPVVFDGRNIWIPKELRDLGFVYYGIGRR